jgi:hypothetical protein
LSQSEDDLGDVSVEEQVVASISWVSVDSEPQEILHEVLNSRGGGSLDSAIGELHPGCHGSSGSGLGVADIDEVPYCIELVAVVDVDVEVAGSIVPSELIVAKSKPDAEWVLPDGRGSGVVGSINGSHRIPGLLGDD